LDTNVAPQIGKPTRAAVPAPIAWITRAHARLVSRHCAAIVSDLSPQISSGVATPILAGERAA
jgi:hypothetical protein